MTITLRKGSKRRTDCHILELGAHTFYFSYRTCVAYVGPAGQARRANRWGPTTGRHMREMGCSEFPTLPDVQFELIIRDAALTPSAP